jgi:hypothetical protein
VLRDRSCADLVAVRRMADVGWSSAQAIERSAQTTFDGPPGVAAPGGHFHVRPPQGGGLIRQKTFRRINPTNLVGQGQNCKNMVRGKKNHRYERAVQLLHSTGLPVSPRPEAWFPRPSGRALAPDARKFALMIVADVRDDRCASIETPQTRNFFSQRTLERETST